MGLKRYKTILLVILLLCSAAMPVAAEQIDFVVLLDVSESVFPIFEDLVDYLIKDALLKYLRYGDYFHLITFANTPQIEISTQIDNQKQAEDVLKHILLLQPLGKYTDLIRALKFLYQYTADLPENRKKTILVLTDGIHDPPPGSPFSPDKRDIQKDIADAAAQIKSKDWNVHIIRLPEPEKGESKGPETAAGEGAGAQSGTFSGSSAGEEPSPSTSAGKDVATPEGEASLSAGSSGKTDSSAAAEKKAKGASSPSGAETPPVAEKNDGDQLLSHFSDDLDVSVTDYNGPGDKTLSNKALGTPTIDAPRDLGKVGYQFTLPLTLENFRNGPLEIKLIHLLLKDGQDILVNEPFKVVKPGEKSLLNAQVRLPRTIHPGDATLFLRPQFEGDLRVSPPQITVDIRLTRRGMNEGPGAGRIVLYIVIAIAALALLVFAILRFRRALEALSSRTAQAIPVKYDPHLFVSEGHSRPIEMIVEGQTNQIGMRNVHLLAPGRSYCVGGDGSHFVIFIHPAPRCVGELRYEKDSYTFYPMKKEHFPEGTPERIEDCLNKKIRMVSINGKEVVFYFKKYISKLEQINRIMHLTEKPGPPEPFED